MGVTQAFFYFNLFELFLIRLRICYHVIYYFIRCVSMSLFSCHMFTIECVSLYNLRMLWFSLYSDSSVNSSSLNVCTLLRKYVVGKNHLPRYMAAIKAPRNKKRIICFTLFQFLRFQDYMTFFKGQNNQRFISYSSYVCWMI